jgi:hypothetical protein
MTSGSACALVVLAVAATAAPSPHLQRAATSRLGYQTLINEVLAQHVRKNVA